jgi:hypothetical protein
MKLLVVIGMDFDAAGQIQTRISAFVRNWKKMGNNKTV